MTIDTLNAKNANAYLITRFEHGEWIQKRPYGHASECASDEVALLRELGKYGPGAGALRPSDGEVGCPCEHSADLVHPGKIHGDAGDVTERGCVC